MNRMTFRSLIVVPVLLVLFCVPSIAAADPITWDLSGVTFDDNGTASGSFVYDAVTNTVSSINIMTFPGTTFTGTTKYTALSPGFNPPLADDIVFVPNASGDLTGKMYFDLELVTSLTNSGGTVFLADFGSEGLCADALCTAAADSPAPFRMITGGEVVSPMVATPEPSAFLLLGMGLVCIMCITKRKMLQA